MKEKNSLTSYKAIVAYDGTDFNGWQSQTDKLAVEDKIEETIFEIFNQDPRIQGSSRTDAGVHAIGQCLKLYLPSTHTANHLKKIINDNLPSNIVFLNLEKVEDTFHARKKITSKTYYYCLSKMKINPLFNRYVYHYPFEFNFTIFQSYLNDFVGNHHFGSFATGEYPEELYKKTVFQCEVVEKESELLFNDKNIIQINITGNGFLKYMIRRMIGAALTLSKKNNTSLLTISYLLNNPNAKQSLFKVPGNGLTLYKINYTL